VSVFEKELRSHYYLSDGKWHDILHGPHGEQSVWEKIDIAERSLDELFEAIKAKIKELGVKPRQRKARR
jgi:hypothetical protein